VIVYQAVSQSKPNQSATTCYQDVHKRLPSSYKSNFLKSLGSLFKTLA
jgi:hypothetical protein